MWQLIWQLPRVGQERDTVGGGWEGTDSTPRCWAEVKMRKNLINISQIKKSLQLRDESSEYCHRNHFKNLYLLEKNFSQI